MIGVLQIKGIRQIGKSWLRQEDPKGFLGYQSS